MIEQCQKIAAEAARKAPMMVDCNVAGSRREWGA
jgi:hypothetical protein